MSRWIPFWLTSLLVGASAGILYAFIFQNGRPLVGAIFGVTTCALLLGFERQLFLPRFQQRLKRLSAPVYGIISVAIYVALIVIANVIAGSAVLALGIISDPFWYTVLPTPRVLSYSLLIAAIVSFLLRMRDLIGSEMFVNLLIGRYHKPVEEERVFLFIDLVGSTSIAERMGPMRYQEFLGRFFATLAEPVRLTRGSLDDYIGDMAVITWPLTRGIHGARCLRCVQAFQKQILDEAEMWRAHFGVLPGFRAALHCGPVVTAEIGVEKHKITYLGDTVNTTARLEELAKTLKAPLLISIDLLERLAVPPDIKVRHLGLHAVRGRDQLLGVAAVE